MIITVKGKQMIIDEANLVLYQARVWHINDNGYVVWRGFLGGVKKTIRFHREVIGAKAGEIVDHINRNKLDNRLKNLRITTQLMNVRNSDRYDNAKGYYYDNKKKRWTVDWHRYNAKGIYVDTEQDAIEYVEALKAGRKVERNFTPRPSIGRAKLNDTSMNQIDEMFSQGLKRYQIANLIGLSNSTIGRYLSGKTWSGRISRRTK